jgi:hypothetical protein
MLFNFLIQSSCIRGILYNLRNPLVTFNLKILCIFYLNSVTEVQASDKQGICDLVKKITTCLSLSLSFILIQSKLETQPNRFNATVSLVNCKKLLNTFVLLIQSLSSRRLLWHMVTNAILLLVGRIHFSKRTFFIMKFDKKIA